MLVSALQVRFSHKYSHRCPLHNDTLEHDCTSKNIVPGLTVSSDGQLDTSLRSRRSVYLQFTANTRKFALLSSLSTP